jgi:hypothetical protein
MSKLIIAAATIAFGALVASAPAQADYNYGPTKNGAQCWKAAQSHGRDGFGAWDACPQAASVAVTNPVRRHRTHR